MATPKQIKHPGYEAHQTEARVPGTGRRSYVRYPVVLDAMIVVPQDRTISCSMRDFCMGGMFLHYKLQRAEEQQSPIAQNELLTVYCFVPDAGGEKLVEFQARIVRNLQDGIGIAFINPNQEFLLIMQRFALQFSLDAEKQQADKVGDIKGNGNSSGGLGRQRRNTWMCST